MKEHIQNELVNALRDVAMTFHSTQQLRERIVRVVQEHLDKDQTWQEEHKNANSK